MVSTFIKHFPKLGLRNVLLALVVYSFILLHADAKTVIPCELADGFDYPVGKPDATGYYKARGFWPNGHLGEDWNGVSGGDSDLGDPIYSIGKGVVVLSEDVRVGWGNCVIIRHIFREPNGKIEMVDSLYGHLLERNVAVGQVVERGELIGTMGGNNGMYPVHLHFEIRKNLQIGMHRSKFARDYSNYYSPTHFITPRRQLQTDTVKYDIVINNFEAYHSSVDASSQLDPSLNQRSNQRLKIPVPDPSALPKQNVEKPTTTNNEDFWSRLRTKLQEQDSAKKQTPTPPSQEKAEMP